MTDHNPTPTTPCRRHGRKALPILAVVLAAGLIGAYATTSFSQSGPGLFGGGPIDPARAEARVDRMVRHLAVELGANADQQEKLSVIAKGLVKDVLPVREKMQAARQQARTLLTAQTVDRAALEKLRADQIATHDAASKRIVQALADAADVLTPEQRTKLNEFLSSHHGRGFGGGWGRGMGGGMMGGGMMGGWR